MVGPPEFCTAAAKLLFGDDNVAITQKRVHLLFQIFFQELVVDLLILSEFTRFLQSLVDPRSQISSNCRSTWRLN